jgi:RNA polymerase sigma factor (sigma-70 family)
MSVRLHRALPEETLPWSVWAKDYGRLIRARLLEHRISPERASELSQEVWEHLYRRWTSGTLVDIKMPGLALSQADFLARSEWRGPGGKVLEDAPDYDVANPYDEEQQLLHRALLERVLKVVRACPPKLQRVFELHYRPPGMSTLEISKELRISEQRVRQALCELRQRVRRFA